MPPTSNPTSIGTVDLPTPFAVAPMAGMTDSAFRRLVKRHGGCGLVVTEMVSRKDSCAGLTDARAAGYTEEERPISIQIFGGDPEKMAAAAQISRAWGPISSTSTWAAPSRRLPSTRPVAA